MKRTKIVCTIGPASKDRAVLEQMIEAGMNVARLNFSHGTHEEHAALIKSIREAALAEHRTVGILQDLQGPRIRLGELAAEGRELKKGERVIINTGKSKAGEIPVTYEKLHEDLKVGERVLIADGAYELVVTKIEGARIETEVKAGGTVTSHKGMNFPDSELKISSLTEKDKDDLKFGLSEGVDFVALSFVSGAADVKELRSLIERYAEELGKSEMRRVLIIPKIEKPAAVKNFDEILAAADGIMIARGDLGIELPPAKVPLLQKKFIQKCRVASKPVIVATQMLESMIKSPRATRAEVSDVANAVIDHTDAVMLSGESAAGQYPVEAVRTMTEIIAETEASVLDDPSYRGRNQRLPKDEALGNVASILAANLKARAVLVATLTGRTARLIARYRPELPILAATNSEQIVRQLALSWGVTSFLLPVSKTIEELIARVISQAKRNDFVKHGDEVIVVAGEPVNKPGETDRISVENIE